MHSTGWGWTLRIWDDTRNGCAKECEDQCGQSRAGKGTRGRDELGQGQSRQRVLGHGGDQNFNLSAKANTVM